MLNLSKFIDENLANIPNFSTRSRYSFNASDAGKSMRDLYWKFKGEPETNPTDSLGFKRMDFGSSLEGTIVGWIRGLAYKGIAIIKQQARVGGTNPNWAGFVDLITLEQVEGGKFEVVVTEIKTKYGYGATLLTQELNPSEDYLLQLGLYLKDFWDKKQKLYRGRLFYMIIPESEQKTKLGAFVEFYCRYEPETGDLVCYQAMGSDCLDLRGFKEIRVSVTKLLDKWCILNEYLLKDELPPVDYVYKHKLTPEFLASRSDTDIKLAAQGYKILGDWQISYSPYKKKHLELQGSSEGYSPDETELLVQEYKRRKPKQRTF